MSLSNKIGWHRRTQTKELTMVDKVGIMIVFNSLDELISQEINKAESKFNENRIASEAAKDISLVSLYTSRAMNQATFAKTLGWIRREVAILSKIVNEQYQDPPKPFTPVQEFKSGLDSTSESKNPDSN
jgi:hypothetical protein